MLGQLSPHLADALAEDRLRTARGRRAVASTHAPGPERAHDEHERQRALVRASLLRSTRSDRPTTRRWA